MGRQTNSRLSRRQHERAYEDYWLGPNTDIGKPGERQLAGLDSRSTDPECVPKVPRRRVRPCTQRQMKIRNGVKAQPLSCETGAGVHRMRRSCGIVSEAKALGKAEGYADRDTMSEMIEVPVGVKTL